MGRNNQALISPHHCLVTTRKGHSLGSNMAMCPKGAAATGCQLAAPLASQLISKFFIKERSKQHTSTIAMITESTGSMIETAKFHFSITLHLSHVLAVVLFYFVFKSKTQAKREATLWSIASSCGRRKDSSSKLTAIRAHNSLAKIGHMVPPTHKGAEVQSYHKQ